MEHPASRLADVPLIQYREVTPHFRKALGVPLLEGRFFTKDDTADRPLVAVINESARKRFFPNVDPIGQRVFPGPPEATIAKLLPSPDFRIPRLTIVGVVGDIKQSGLTRPTQPALFVPHLQGTVKDNETSATKMFLFIKTDSGPLRCVSTARAAVQSLDPAQPVADVSTMQQLLNASMAPEHFSYFCSDVLLLLRSLWPQWAFTAYCRSRCGLGRKRSGFAWLLGANAADVLKMMVVHGLRLGLAGVFLGLLLGAGTTRLLSSLLFSVKGRRSDYVFRGIVGFDRHRWF